MHNVSSQMVRVRVGHSLAWSDFDSLELQKYFHYFTGKTAQRHNIFVATQTYAINWGGIVAYTTIFDARQYVKECTEA